jgi:hypothetical protein
MNPNFCGCTGRLSRCRLSAGESVGKPGSPGLRSKEEERWKTSRSRYGLQTES